MIFIRLITTLRFLVNENLNYFVQLVVHFTQKFQAIYMQKCQKYLIRKNHRGENLKWHNHIISYEEHT